MATASFRPSCSFSVPYREILIVLDRLRRGEHAGVKGGRTLELFHHNLAFVDHPVDGVTDFASCGLFDELENPLEPLDLILSLALVFLEGSLQLFRLDSFRHLRKSGEVLSFRRSRCLSGSREEVFKHLLFWPWTPPGYVFVRR
jgi:hypothetical protein